MAGAKGRSGRRPKEFSERWRFLVERAKVLERQIDTAAGKNAAAGPADEIAAARLVLGYAYGPPKQEVEHTGDVGLSVRVVRE